MAIYLHYINICAQTLDYIMCCYPTKNLKFGLYKDSYQAYHKEHLLSSIKVISYLKMTIGKIISVKFHVSSIL